MFILGLVEVTDQQIGIFDYKGWRWSYAVHSPELLDALEDYDDFGESDVVVFTFPKTGQSVQQPIVDRPIIWRYLDHVQLLCQTRAVCVGIQYDIVVFCYCCTEFYFYHAV